MNPSHFPIFKGIFYKPQHQQIIFSIFYCFFIELKLENAYDDWYYANFFKNVIFLNFSKLIQISILLPHHYFHPFLIQFYRHYLHHLFQHLHTNLHHQLNWQILFEYFHSTHLSQNCRLSLQMLSFKFIQLLFFKFIPQQLVKTTLILLQKLITLIFEGQHHHQIFQFQNLNLFLLS